MCKINIICKKCLDMYEIIEGCDCIIPKDIYNVCNTCNESNKEEEISKNKKNWCINKCIIL